MYRLPIPTLSPTAQNSQCRHPLAQLLGLAGLLFNTALHADTAADVHGALKERWYTTELIIFRNLDAPARESLLLEGERMSVAEERRRGTQLELPEDDPALNKLTLDPEVASDAGLTTVQVLTTDERPELDAEPWDEIKDYESAPDLGELVARNMATWETQLRARDGEPMSEEELQLTATAEKLLRSRGVEVLLHTGWTQAVPARDAGESITLSAGDEYADPRDGSARARLEGEVTVTLGRYLHVHPTLFYTPQDTSQPDLDLVEQEPAGPMSAVARAREAARAAGAASGAPEVRDLSSSSSALDRLREREVKERFEQTGPQQTTATNFEQELPPYIRLDQSRRVRSGELHYIDHPELGVIVRITPAVAPEALQEQFALLQ